MLYLAAIVWAHLGEMIMDYSTPATVKQSGREAFKLGVKRSECPIERRTGANDIHHWLSGWDEEEKNAACFGKNCKAIRGVGHSEECLQEHTHTVNGI